VDEGTRATASGFIEEACGDAILDNATSVQKYHIMSEPPRLADVVRHEYNLDTLLLGIK
jgi:hypothetical protein